MMKKEKQTLVIIRRQLYELFEEDKETGELRLKPWRPWDVKYHGRMLYSGDIGEALVKSHDRIIASDKDVDEVRFIIKEEGTQDSPFESVEKLAKIAREGIKDLSYHCLNKRYLICILGSTGLIATLAGLPYILFYWGKWLSTQFYVVSTIIWIGMMIGIILSLFFGYRKSQRWGKTFFKLSLLPITVFYQSMLPEYQEAKKEKEMLQKALN